MPAEPFRIFKIDFSNRNSIATLLRFATPDLLRGLLPLPSSPCKIASRCSISSEAFRGAAQGTPWAAGRRFVDY